MARAYIASTEDPDTIEIATIVDVETDGQGNQTLTLVLESTEESKYEDGQCIARP